MREKINQILENLPEEEMENVYWSILPIQEDFLYRKNLQQKGVTITRVFEDDEEIIDLWDKTFAHNISEDVKASIYYEQFKWHIFSYEKQVCLKEDEARKAFDAVPKDELYVMYQGVPIIYQFNNAKHVVASDFDSQQDIYIFDKDYTWTYVHTHESTCGPYFFEMKKF